MRDKHAMIFRGEDWNLTAKNDIINQLYDDKKMHLDEKFEVLLDSLDDITKKKYVRFQQEENKAIKRIKDDINLLMYNKRKMVEQTKKMIAN